jgi:hypothetical protein
VGERLDPLRKTIEVEVSAADAFRIWTEELGDWWPLATHSVGRGDAVPCILKGRTGGWLYETTRPGEQHVWGTLATPGHALRRAPGRACPRGRRPVTQAALPLPPPGGTA